MSHVRQELLTLPEHMSSPTLFSGVRVFCVMLCIHHRLSFFFLAIVLSVLLQFTDSDYPLISSNFSYLSSTSTDFLHSRNGLLYCVHKICLFNYLCLILETDIFFCVLFLFCMKLFSNCVICKSTMSLNLVTNLFKDLNYLPYTIIYTIRK